MRRFVRCAALVAAVGAGQGVQALGREVPFEEFSGPLSQQITWVTTCGEWASGGRSGFFRIVHAERFAQSYLYVQWMARREDGDHTTVATASVRELNNDHADISLDHLACRAVRDGVAVSAAATFGHESVDGTVVVRASGRPGTYRFTRRPR